MFLKLIAGYDPVDLILIGYFYISNELSRMWLKTLDDTIILIVLKSPLKTAEMI